MSNSSLNQIQKTHMDQAVQLANKAVGHTSPNPAVGALIVKEGRIIGEGFTLPPGQHHAEIVALRQAGSQANGSELYTTLEPCCTFGRTPPCTAAIIEAGVETVFVASIDPNPQVSGKGCETLREAGISVIISTASGVPELYEGFTKHILQGIPFITAKYAMSLDGKIATASGDSKWVTGTKSRLLVQELRNKCDAILVGINTVLSDDPQLTCRDESGDPLQRQPLRVVLDSKCRFPKYSRMLHEPGETLIITSIDAQKNAISELRALGVTVIQSSSRSDEYIDWDEVLNLLGQQNIINLLVEGGSGVLGSLFDGGWVDKVYAFIAPKIIGGKSSLTPIGGKGAKSMDVSWHLNKTSWELVGQDWLVIGYPTRAD